GLPKNPRKLNPHLAPEAARRRQETVLRRMRENGALDSARHDRAAAEALALRPPQRRFRAPHFVEMVLHGPGSSAPAATEIRTTLDFRLNERVDTIVRDRL